MKISYYPGCSLEGTAREYDLSTRAACGLLGIDLVEIPDWNCCGANAASAVDEELGVKLALRNLGIADKTGMDLVVPCVGCFNRMRWAKHVAKEEPQKAAGVDYAGKSKLVFLLDLFTREDVFPKIKESVKKPLSAMKVACYYGCVIVRPPSLTGSKDCENPQALDNVMKSLGATTVDWPLKTDCCGSDLGLTKSDMMKAMVAKILNSAADAGAEALVIACPLCHTNLDSRQSDLVSSGQCKTTMPVFYFTEMVGLALGAPTMPWWKKHITDPRPYLAAKKLI